MITTIGKITSVISADIRKVRFIFILCVFVNIIAKKRLQINWLSEANLRLQCRFTVVKRRWAVDSRSEP